MKRRDFLKAAMVLLPSGLLVAKGFASPFRRNYMAGVGNANVILRPTSNYATLTGFTASAGEKYECVDEETANGDTDYIYRSDTDGGQGFDNLPTLPNGTILGVAVYITAKEVGGDTTITPRLYTGADVSRAAPTGPQNITTSYAEYSYEWTTNPATSAAWTKAEAEGSDATNPLVGWGFYGGGIGAGETTRVTQVYLVVRYN